jgi:phytoene synthase
MQHDDLLTCRRLLQGGSRSFYAASLVLPRNMREAATALYAFCRLADDAIDGGDDPARELALLNARLDRVYSGHPIDHAADRAFASIVDAYDIPRALPQALLEGFAWDAAGRRYETLEGLCGYAARVAGSVGVMMTLLMGQRDAAVLARASDLGVAMQLTNIARDVGEDARAGRLYLPLRWLRDAGIDPDSFMARPVFTPALASVVQRLLAVADGLYARSSAGVAHLPLRCRPGMHAARVLYAEIGNEVARRGHDSVAHRAVVPASGKMRALAEAVVACFAMPRDLTQPALRETQFLIDAVAASSVRAGVESYPAWWDIGARALRVFELFERLERREQTRRA